MCAPASQPTCKGATLRMLWLLLGLMAWAPSWAQVEVHFLPNGQVRYVRPRTDPIFTPNGGIGRPLRGVDHDLWYAYDPWIRGFCEEEGVDVALAKAAIYHESGYRWRATSKAGARGLMQLMKGTAARFGSSGDDYEPINNIRCGVRYLAYLQTYYKGNLIKIVAAYNSGEGNVDKYGGIPPFRETRAYVPKVLNTWNWIAQSNFMRGSQ